MRESIPKKRLVVGAALAVPLVVAVVVAVAARPAGGGPSPPAGTPPEGMRTVLVSGERMPAPSEPGSVLRALRVSGRIPKRTATGTVLTDEDCAPDARGVSRCANRVQLGGGGTLSLRHPHRMMEVACLSPGERVRLRAA